MDHSLVLRSGYNQQNFITPAKKLFPHIIFCYPSDLVKTGEFLDILQHILSQDDDHSKNAAELWGPINSITDDIAIKVFRKRKNANWLEDFWQEMEPVIAAKKDCLAEV